MISIKAVDKYTIQFYKRVWLEEDLFLAACLDLKIEGEVIFSDIRITSKKALLYFIQKSFQTIAYSPNQESFRNAIYATFKNMYANAYNEFMSEYHSKMGYLESVGKDLYQHQKDTLASSINRHTNLWALDMGTGKTLTAATLSKITQANRTVIICPSLVKWNWFDDMTRDWGYNPMYWTILDSIKSKTIKAFRERFVVLNYEQVANNMNYLLSDEINHIIIDEAHYLKNSTSNRSQAVHKLLKESGYPRLTMLTGTPVTNRINDMFNYLKMSKHPLGKNYDKFKKLYAVTAKVRGETITGAKNIPDLKGKISNLMIRLRSEDCLDLPPMVIKKYYFEPNDLSAEYEIELQGLKDKKQKYDSLHGVEKQKMRTEIRGNIHTLNRLVSTSKVNPIKELVDKLTDIGEKVIVFCGYTDPLDRLEELLGDSCIKINGSVNAHKRRTLIDKFKNDPSCMVFLGNMQAAGIGINLVNARHVIFMNFPFTPDQIEQAQKRAHRSGQERRVFIYYTIAKETIDEHIYSLVIDKSSDINELIDGDHQGVTNYANIEGELFKRLIS